MEYYIYYSQYLFQYVKISTNDNVSVPLITAFYQHVDKGNFLIYTLKTNFSMMPCHHNMPYLFLHCYHCFFVLDHYNSVGACVCVCFQFSIYNHLFGLYRERVLHSWSPIIWTFSIIQLLIVLYTVYINIFSHFIPFIHCSYINEMYFLM